MGKYWTKAEITFLEKKWGKWSIEQIAESLNRSYYSVTKKACRLNLTDSQHHWTESEDQYLRENYPKGVSVAKISQHLNLTQKQINHRCRTLGVKRNKIRHKWSEADDKFLRKNYHKKSLGHLCQSLNCYQSEIYIRVKILGLTQSVRKTRKWTRKQDQYLIDNYSTMKIIDIAKHLRRTDGSVKNRIRILKLNNANYDFGEKLKAFRLDHDLKQQDVALKLGVSCAYVSCIERGLVTASKNIIKRFGEAYDKANQD